MDLILSSASTRDRLETTGILPHKTAVDLGVVGVAARASGVDIDVRRDFPYAAYDEIPPKVVLHSKGDVFDRMRVRMEEAGDSIRIALEALGRLSAGPVSTALPPIPSGKLRSRLCRRLARGDPPLGSHQREWQFGSLQDQRSFIEQLASPARSRPRQHHSGFPGHQQKLQSLLLRNRPMNHSHSAIEINQSDRKQFE